MSGQKDEDIEDSPKRKSGNTTGVPETLPTSQGATFQEQMTVILSRLFTTTLKTSVMFFFQRTDRVPIASCFFQTGERILVCE